MVPLRTKLPLLLRLEKKAPVSQNSVKVGADVPGTKGLLRSLDIDEIIWAE